jgi:hypothetical protein
MKRESWSYVGRLQGKPLYRHRRTSQYAVEEDYLRLRALSRDEQMRLPQAAGAEEPQPRSA